MTHSDRTPRSKGAISSPDGDVRRAPLVRLRLVLILLLAILLGIYGAMALRSHWRPAVAEDPASVTLETDFPGKAYSDQATVQDVQMEAQQAVEELLELYPKLVQAHYASAHWNLMLDRVVESAKAWRRCIDLAPMNGDAYVSLAALELDDGRHTEAIRLLRQAMACTTQDPRVPGLLADALLKDGEINEATALLERQIMQGQGSAASVTLLGQCYLQQDDFERAKTLFQSAIAQTPKSTKAYYGLAQSCQRLGEMDRAKEYMSHFQDLTRAERAARSEEAKTFSDVTTMKEIAAETLVDVGRIYLEQGDTRAAEEALLKASVFDERDQDCWELLVLLFEQTQEPAKGLLALQKLCEINPKNSAYWLNRSLLAGRLMRRQEALEAIEKAISLNPNDPECRRVYEILRNG